MPITKTITLYHYDELSDKAKERARDWFTASWPEHDWWENTYEDARNIGVKLDGFDMDSASFVRDVKAEFIEGGNSTLEKILSDHGESCDTYKAAKKFEAAVDAIPELPAPDSPAYHLMERESCSLFDALEGEFLDDLRECYRKMLQAEYDSMFEKDYIEERIRINEYTFTESGKREDLDHE